VKTILALETSCDETAVAILRSGNVSPRSELLASEVASQIAEHDKYGGVVPEVASRNHLLHAPRLLDRATRDANIKIGKIDGFAATTGPGLASSLMIGASIAKSLAIGFEKPYLAVNHLEGHVLSPFFVASASSRSSSGNHRQDADATIPRHVSLVVSGGHTMSVLVGGLGDYRIIGRTLDDAAGEAFDKVAKLLGLGYPGGPEIEKHARAGDPTRFALPRSMLDSDNFSFSGLKTAVRYLLPKIGAIPNREDDEGSRRSSADTQTISGSQTAYGGFLRPFGRRGGLHRGGRSARDDRLLPDLCASFQQAVIDVLVRKTIVAARKYHVDLITMSGGVSCNQELRRQLGHVCAAENFAFKAAERWLCTDNAAMIAFAAMLRLQRGFHSNVTEEIDPNLALA